MSGSLPEDQAGLYVLGALGAEEMRAIRIAASRDSDLAAEIAAWERRLAPLVRLIPEAAPPASLWPQLDSRLSRIATGGSASAEVYQVPVTRARRKSRAAGKLDGWRIATGVSLALAASLAAVAILNRAPPPERLAMVMPARPGEGGWLVRIDATGAFHVQARGALSRALDQDYELWAMPEGTSKPLAIGLLPINGAATVKPAKLPGGAYQLLVSLEPKGGSPTGLPTGPVMYAGDIVTP